MCKSTKALLTNCSYLLATFSLALTLACFNGLHLLAEQILKKYGLKSMNLATMNLIEIPILIVFVVVYGHVYSRIGRAKPILIFNMAALLALIFLIWACLDVHSVFLFAFLMVSQVAFAPPSLGLTLQLAADITFPICKNLLILAEAVSAGMVFIAEKILSFGLTEGFSPLVDQGKSVPIILILLGCQGVSFICILFVNGKYCFILDR